MGNHLWVEKGLDQVLWSVSSPRQCGLGGSIGLHDHQGGKLKFSSPWTSWSWNPRSNSQVGIGWSVEISIVINGTMDRKRYKQGKEDSWELDKSVGCGWSQVTPYMIFNHALPLPGRWPATNRSPPVAKAGGLRSAVCLTCEVRAWERQHRALLRAHAHR